MNNDELKAALLTKTPVLYTSHDGSEIKYKYVSAIRYIADNGRIRITAEITDVNENSVTICDPERLSNAERGKQ